MSSKPNKTYSIAGVVLTAEIINNEEIKLNYSSGDTITRDLIVEAINQRLKRDHIIHRFNNALNNPSRASETQILSTTFSPNVIVMIDPVMGGAGMHPVTPEHVTNILDDLERNFNTKEKLSEHVEALVTEAEERLETRRPHPDDATHAAKEQKRKAAAIQPYLDAVNATLGKNGVFVDDELNKQLKAALIKASEQMRGGGSGFTPL